MTGQGPHHLTRHRIPHPHHTVVIAGGQPRPIRTPRTRLASARAARLPHRRAAGQAVQVRFGLPGCPVHLRVLPGNSAKPNVGERRLGQACSHKTGPRQIAESDRRPPQPGVPEVGIAKAEDCPCGPPTVDDEVIQVCTTEVDALDPRDRQGLRRRDQAVAEQQFGDPEIAVLAPPAEGGQQLTVLALRQHLSKEHEGLAARHPSGPSLGEVALDRTQQVAGQEVLGERGVGEPKIAPLSVVHASQERCRAEVLF